MNCTLRLAAHAPLACARLRALRQRIVSCSHSRLLLARLNGFGVRGLLLLVYVATSLYSSESLMMLMAIWRFCNRCCHSSSPALTILLTCRTADKCFCLDCSLPKADFLTPSPIRLTAASLIVWSAGTCAGLLS